MVGSGSVVVETGLENFIGGYRRIKRIRTGC